MRSGLIRYMLLALTLGCASCSEDESLPIANDSGVTFELAVAGEGENANPTGDPQLTRLFVAERKPGYDEKLYCDKSYLIEGNHLKVDHLYEQWYKFAFFHVPAIEANTMGDKLFEYTTVGDGKNEFYDMKLDYAPLLDYQKNLNDACTHNLSVYRKIVDRWINADVPASENVIMERITGLLILNMGKPADQFYTKGKGAVTSMDLTISTFPQCYLRDKGNGEVIADDKTKQEFTFTWKVAADQQLTPQELPVMLLPGVIEGTVTVHFANTQDVEVYTLQTRGEGNEKDKPVEIKPNRRTIVLFNGISSDYFEIRYAGFEDGNDSVVDVDDDNWDGIEQL